MKRREGEGGYLRWLGRPLRTKISSSWPFVRRFSVTLSWLEITRGVLGGVVPGPCVRPRPGTCSLNKCVPWRCHGRYEARNLRTALPFAATGTETISRRGLSMMCAAEFRVTEYQHLFLSLSLSPNISHLLIPHFPFLSFSFPLLPRFLSSLLHKKNYQTFPISGPDSYAHAKDLMFLIAENYIKNL